MTSVRRLIVNAAIGACALAGLASSGAYAASPEGMKLYQFTSQYLDIAKSALSSATSGDEKILIPVGFYLIRHPKGDVLFDTGDNDKLLTDKTYWGPLAAMLDKGVNPDLAIETQLGKVGVKATDIKYVILGHMHLDHAGNVGRFPNATIVVQRDEIINAFWPPKDYAGPYISGDFEKLRADTGSAISRPATDDRAQRRSRLVWRRQHLHPSRRRAHTRKPDGGCQAAEVRHHRADQRHLLPGGEPGQGHSPEYRADLQPDRNAQRLRLHQAGSGHGEGPGLHGA